MFNWLIMPEKIILVWPTVFQQLRLMLGLHEPYAVWRSAYIITKIERVEILCTDFLTPFYKTCNNLQKYLNIYNRKIILIADMAVFYKGGEKINKV